MASGEFEHEVVEEVAQVLADSESLDRTHIANIVIGILRDRGAAIIPTDEEE